MQLFKHMICLFLKINLILHYDFIERHNFINRSILNYIAVVKIDLCTVSPSRQICLPYFKLERFLNWVNTALSRQLLGSKSALKTSLNDSAPSFK